MRESLNPTSFCGGTIRRISSAREGRLLVAPSTLHSLERVIHTSRRKLFNRLHDTFFMFPEADLHLSYHSKWVSTRPFVSIYMSLLSNAAPQTIHISLVLSRCSPLKHILPGSLLPCPNLLPSLVGWRKSVQVPHNGKLIIIAPLGTLDPLCLAQVRQSLQHHLALGITIGLSL